MPTDRNRYAPIRTTRLRREKRALPQQGYLEDSNRWWRCWNCGFLINEDRTALGGDESHSGVTPVQYSEAPDFSTDWGSGEGALRTMIVPDVSGTIDVTLRALDQAGIPIPAPVSFKPDVSSGCPLCGTLNWR